MKIKVTKEKYNGTDGILFEEGFEIVFDNKINVIVGSNGSGKTTIMNALRSFSPYKDYNEIFSKNTEGFEVEGYEYDEVHSYFSDRDDPDVLNEYAKVRDTATALFSSTGEKQHSMVQGLIQRLKQGDPLSQKLVLLDELEKGFDIKTQMMFPNLIHYLSENSDMVICSSHNIGLLNSPLVDEDVG